MSPFARSASVLLALAPAAAAQCPPGASMPQDLSSEATMPDPGAAATRWRAAQDAAKNGDRAAAKLHLFAALEFHPSSPVLLFDLALALHGDADLQALWAERFVRAASDAQGKLKLDAAAKKRSASAAGFDALLLPAQELAALRAQALAELARFCDKHKAAGKQNAARALRVSWACELLLEVGAGAPAAVMVAAPAVAKVQQAFAPDYDVVFQALARVLQKKPPAAPANGTPATGSPATGSPATGSPATGADANATAVADRRVRAARLLVGLRRQASLEDLQGPTPPDVDQYADAAQQVLDEHAAATLASVKVWTISELEAMSGREAVLFTHEHRDWLHPGVALSPNGRYRIETICGHATLLGVAKTVELHHARLVGHYGSDPFEQRQGVVRIVPEVTDLETEGAPFWWAGGFQRGDETTVRFAWDRIPTLGRVLTHELTHRFDGVLRSFLGPWYGEGHAEWTGRHYARMADTRFVETHLDIGTLAHTFYKGYGNREKFVELLQGKVEDYRDNYFAGYSLYAFLRSVPPDRPRYRDAVAGYEKNARAGQKDALAYFTSCFCDGKQGRPPSFDEFFADWERCLRACYEWNDDRRQGHEWLAQYTGIGQGDTADIVMDEPTWSWGRTRAEPFFGQGHAADATLLLHEVQDVEGTIAAGVWSTTVDGWRLDTGTALLVALRASRSQDAAHAFAAIAVRHFPQLAGTEAPVLLAALPKTKLLLDALEKRARALAAANAPAAAAALAQDHARIASLFGLPQLAGLPDGAPPALARGLGGGGYTETSLTDYEDRREPGLWYATADGDLHVGREKPREGTGSLDRTAHQRDAFVHTVAWQAPGSYVVRGRVYITTSYASGAIVFGHTRRDRDLRLVFETGDFAYATGRSEQNQAIGKVSFDLRGLWERDRQMPDGTPHVSADVSVDAPFFDFALHVRGPRVLVEINGEPEIRYAVHDGAPIEGHVGFAMGMGAIRVHQPTVQRADGDAAAMLTGLALDRPAKGPLDDLMLLPVRGVPLHGNGTLVLWLPKVADGSPGDLLPRAMLVLEQLMKTTHEHPQHWVLAVPREMTQEQRAAALAAIGDARVEPLPVLEHVVGEPFTGNDPWVLFVDALGTLRAAAAAIDPALHSKVERWARKFRQR